MSLKSTPVSRCLEKKLLFFGYELPDVLAIFMLLAVLNLTLGRTEYKFLLVWLPVDRCNTPERLHSVDVDRWKDQRHGKDHHGNSFR